MAPGIDLEIGAGGGLVGEAERFLVRTDDDLYEFVNDAGEGVQLILDLGVHTPSQTVVFQGKRKMTLRGPRGAFVQPPAGVATVFKFEDLLTKHNEFLVLEGFSILGNELAGDMILCEGSMLDCFFRNLEIDGNHALTVLMRLAETWQGCKVESCIMTGLYKYGVQADPTGADENLDSAVTNCHFLPRSGTVTAAIYLIGALIKRLRLCHNAFSVEDAAQLDTAVLATGGILDLLLSDNIMTTTARALDLEVHDGAVLNNIIRSAAANEAVRLNNSDRCLVGQNRIIASVADSIREEATSDQNLYVGNSLVSSVSGPTFLGTNRTEVGTKV